MMLNPNKCAFRVESGKFLGYILHQCGIEASSEKIRALLEMKSPRRVKEVQSLTERIAALSRFISKATNKCHLFFITLKMRKDSNGAKSANRLSKT